MKGFKPTGFGPSAGFKFPASFGFTGSTGAYTNVQPYVRQKPRAFKDGGYVSESVPDPGHATVQRSRPYTEEDRESGGKSPLRPGFKHGGKWIAGAIKHPGALHQALGVPAGEKIPAKKMAKAAKSSSPLMRRRVALAKTLGKMHKADGGDVSIDRVNAYGKRAEQMGRNRDSERNAARDMEKELIKRNTAPEENATKENLANRYPFLDESWRHKSHGPQSSGPLSQAIAMKGKFAAADGGTVYGSSSKGFGSDVRKTGEFVGQIPRMITDALKGTLRRTQEDVATDKRRRIDSIADDTNTASNYARGGKMRRMGYSHGGKMKRMGYADGGGVSRMEAKKIAQSTIGEHVRYPAPKGHKGLGKMCSK